ncbi:MAG: hypothetical protein WDO73_19735 [Ignavibacteriota bacterium]
MRRPVLAAILGFTQLFAQDQDKSKLPRMNFPVNLQNSARVHDLLRAGNLYLSLQDALALAIENNLDIELQRFAFPVANAELLRSQGGGAVRGLNFTLAEVPTGVGGPLSPVETGAAVAGEAATGVSVASSATELGVLGRRRITCRFRAPSASRPGHRRRRSIRRLWGC